MFHKTFLATLLFHMGGAYIPSNEKISIKFDARDQSSLENTLP